MSKQKLEASVAAALAAQAEQKAALEQQFPVGSRVVYVPNHSVLGNSDNERGVVTSCNHLYVFVRYEKQHSEANGQATMAENLRRMS